MKNEISVKVKSAIALLIALLLVTTWLLHGFIQKERVRDLGDWEVTLSVMADTRSSNIEQWIADQFTPLVELSENGSLQLYLSQLTLVKNSKSSDPEPAQKSYLRNLLKATALRAGIISPDTRNIKIPANLSLPTNNGLALVDSEGNILISTPSMPLLSGNTIQIARNAIENGVHEIVDIHLNNNRKPVMGFIVPIAGLNGLSNGESDIGAVIAIKEVSSTLFPLLKSNTTRIDTDEAYLVRYNSDMPISYLTPLMDGTTGLTKQLPSTLKDIIDAKAINTPGAFTSGIDYNDTPVIFVSRIISSAPWVLIQKVDLSEARQEGVRHENQLIIFFILSVSIILLIVVSAWRHGVSVREREAADNLKLTTNKLAENNRLLNNITGNILDFILVLDQEENINFINRSLESTLKINAADVAGKSLITLFGPYSGNKIHGVITEAKASGATHAKELSLDINGNNRQFYTIIVPTSVPDQSSPTFLLTLHDTTELRKSEKQRYRLNRQLIDALMHAIDLHDPFSANHSARVCEVANAIAEEMNLNYLDRSTLDTAASLCNIGKILIPKELLTKTAPLSQSEMDILQEETKYAEQVLKDIDFPGNVAGTIIQKNEHLDGTGHPAGAKEAEILLPSRILCVANAFVAMISPRAYREKMETKEALDALLAKDDWYDRNVLAALFHVAENKLHWD
ncbi:MAG: PAS domain S-box protein [Sedimenticola sp.]|nr:PAS domain S-box protein [Sedimenticola sp.]